MNATTQTSTGMDSNTLTSDKRDGQSVRRRHKPSTDKERLCRWRLQQLDGTSTRGSGNGSLTDSTRWGSRRGGKEETWRKGDV